MRFSRESIFDLQPTRFLCNRRKILNQNQKHLFVVCLPTDHKHTSETYALWDLDCQSFCRVPHILYIFAVSLNFRTPDLRTRVVFYMFASSSQSLANVFIGEYEPLLVTFAYTRVFYLRTLLMHGFAWRNIRRYRAVVQLVGQRASVMVPRNERENAFFVVEFNYPARELSTHLPTRFWFDSFFRYRSFSFLHWLHLRVSGLIRAIIAWCTRPVIVDEHFHVVCLSWHLI